MTIKRIAIYSKVNTILFNKHKVFTKYKYQDMLLLKNEIYKKNNEAI